jgi:hypothetical protein
LEKKSLQGAVNELKGRMLELMVYRALNKYRKTAQPIADFRQKVRPIDENAQVLQKLLTAVSTSRFEIIFSNYSLQLPQATGVELDVLALGEDAASCWALVFEVKNRDEKHRPLKKEAELFVGNVQKVKHWLAQKQKEILFVCPVYLSAKGFDSEIERWLQGQGVLTADLAFFEPAEIERGSSKK